MIHINKQRPILVTGATGYVAGWIIKKLIKDGYTIHAAVRNPNDTSKITPLNNLAKKSLGSIKFFKTDLFDEGSYDHAMRGCELVFHTASPFTNKVSDPQKQLVNPALRGTRNVLQSANRCTSVKRIVFTSSITAIFGDNKDLRSLPNGTADENDWNTSSSLTHQPLSYAQTIAEKEAWKINELQSRWDLVTINPALLYGPGTTTTFTSESQTTLCQLAKGKMRFGAPNLEFGIVDVREAATAHINVAFLPEAKGRYIISAHRLTYLQIAKILESAYPNQFLFPKFKQPNFLTWLAPSVVGLTREIALNNLDYPWLVNNTKSTKQLKINYRPADETLIDQFKQLLESGTIQKR